jgi:hypothetical protein
VLPDYNPQHPQVYVWEVQKKLGITTSESIRRLKTSACRLKLKALREYLPHDHDYHKSVLHMFGNTRDWEHLFKYGDMKNGDLDDDSVRRILQDRIIHILHLHLR